MKKGSHSILSFSRTQTYDRIKKGDVCLGPPELLEHLEGTIGASPQDYMYSPKMYWNNLTEHVFFSNTSLLLWNWAFKDIKQAPEAKHKSKAITYRPVISAFCRILLAAKPCFQSYEAVTLYCDGAENIKELRRASPAKDLHQLRIKHSACEELICPT